MPILEEKKELPFWLLMRRRLHQVGRLLFALLLLTLGLIWLVKSDRVNPKYTGSIHGYLKQLGLLKPTVPGYFSALKTQNLFYDYNNDGAVTGEDYSPLLFEIEGNKPSVKGETAENVLAATADSEAGTSNMQLPSTRGFGSDAFNGAATVSYPIDLPPGPAGLTPSLDLSYSSSSVDDLYTGSYTNYRSQAQNRYQNQAGIVGLGWNLGGVQYIARDTKGSTLRALTSQSDDTFILAFSGGSANLSKESETGTDYGKYSVWRTVPNLKVKVERWSRCKRDAADDGTFFCRYHWQVTTGDGTKYYFGTPTTTTAWQKKYDPDKNEDLEHKEYDWYPLYDNDANPVGPNAWLISGPGGYHALTYRWYLSKVESVFDKDTLPVEINYTYNLKIEYAGHDDYYVSAAYPLTISYGKHEISFQREPRLDYKIHQGDNASPKRPLRNLERLKKIIVKTLGKVRRVYVLDYQYGWEPSRDHPNDDGDGISESDSEVTSGQVIHSLLKKITVYNDDPDTNTSAKRLPEYTFSYGNDCGGFKGGCPLTSYVTSGTANVAQTPYDFFLQTASNGYGGKVTFEYWKDAGSNNALNIKYCDRDKVALDGGICKTNNKFNTQRHRISAQIVEDGMGNSVRTNYTYTGNGATLGLGAVKNYDEVDEEAEIFNSFSGFEFLGYPEVETTVFDKNSTSKVVAKTKSFFRQAMETSNCFKPSPLKGITFKTQTFDTNNNNKWMENENGYTVRFGPMMDPAKYVNKYDVDLNGYCDSYNPEDTVTLVLATTNLSKSYMPNPTLCTRTVNNYENLDNSPDPYANPHRNANWGRVSCSDTWTDDTSDAKRFSITDYTSADTLKWILPKPKESWISTSAMGIKYNHSQVFYDNQVFGKLGDYGQPTKSSVLVDGAAYADTTITYDATYPWLPIKSTDLLGRSTITTYDNVFHMYPTKVTNHLGQSTTTVYDFNIADSTHPNYGGVLGIPVRVTDANGKVSSSVYDVFGRVTETYLPGKNPGSGVKPDSFSKYYYFNESEISPCNDNNNCLMGLGKNKVPKMMVYSGSRFADDGGAGKVSAAHTYYDGLGQTVQTRQLWYENEYSNAGIPVDGTNQDIIKSQTYNALGQVEYQSLNYTVNPYVPSSQNSYDTRNFVGSANIQKIKYTFDGMGRATTVNYPDGTSETTEYDVAGNPLVTKSSNKNCTDPDSSTLCSVNQTTKDAFGQTRKVEEIAGNKTYSTGFEYHPILGLLTKTKDTLGNVVNQVQYDVLGRKVRMWDVDMSPTMSGDTNSWRYEYDKIGNLVKQTNPKGDVSNLSYDTLNRILTKSVNSSLLLENIYDACTNGVGRSCEVRSYDLTNGSLLQTSKSQYDNRGRVINSTLTLSNLPNSSINNQSFTTSFTYDLGGRLITQTRSGNSTLSIPSETLTYTYNRPYLTQIAGTNNYVTNARYNKDGQLNRFTSGNGVNNSFAYNPTNSRLTSLKVTGPSLADSNELMLSYTYDPLGNIKKINDDNALVPATNPFYLTQNFTYDGLNRLTGVSGAYTAAYKYDDIGNITGKTEEAEAVSLQYDSYTSGFYHRPQKANIGGTNYTYTFDHLGNLTADGQRNYEYDKENRVIKISPVQSAANVTTGGFKETRFYYDAAGSRMAKSVTSGETTYYISPELEVVIQPSGNSGWRQNYYFSGKLIAVREHAVPDTTPVPTPTIIPSPTPGTPDADGNGIINMDDFKIWINNYSSLVTQGQTKGDFNLNQKVEILDFVLWLKAFGVPSPLPSATALIQPTPVSKLNEASVQPADTSVTGSSPSTAPTQAVVSPNPSPALGESGAGTQTSSEPGCTIAMMPSSATTIIGQKTEVIAQVSNISAGAISAVVFYSSDTQTATLDLASDTLAPYTVTVSSQAVGESTITAMVYIDGKMTCQNTAKIIVDTVSFAREVQDSNPQGQILQAQSDQSASLYYIHQDHLGSSTLVTDSTGKLVSKQVYFPYGTTRSVSGNLPTERQYTSQVSDTDETGLYYYNARYYNPQIAKFTQADEGVDIQNRYAYVRNNPMALVDPDGHQACPFWDFWWGGTCLKDAFIEDVRNIKETAVAMAQSFSADPDGFVEDVATQVLPQFAVYAGVMYVAGPQAAEAVDTTLCALSGDPGMCAIAAQAAGPNVSSKADDLAAVLDESKEAVRRDLMQQSKQLYFYSEQAWNNAADTGLSFLKGNFGARNRYGIFVMNQVDPAKTLDTLGHEYMHEIHLRNMLPEDQNFGVAVDSEIFAWGQMAKAPYLPDTIRTYNQSVVDWFERQRMLGFTDARIYKTYRSGSRFPNLDIPKYDRFTGKKNFYPR